MIYNSQGGECDDCDKDFQECECEKCDDCKYRKCLCDLNLPLPWESKSENNRKEVSKKAVELAAQTLNREDFRKLKNLLYSKQDRIY